MSNNDIVVADFWSICNYYYFCVGRSVLYASETIIDRWTERDLKY